MGVECYIPLVCLHPATDPTGQAAVPALLMSGDPRSEFHFQFGASGIAAKRIFFVRDEDTDDGYHNGDVRTSYTLRLALPPMPHGHTLEWGELYRKHWCAVNSWLRAGPSAPMGVMGGVVPPGSSWSLCTPERYKQLSVGYLTANTTGDAGIFGLESQLAELMDTTKPPTGWNTPQKDQDKFVPGKLIRESQQQGIKLLLWGNMRMQPDTLAINKLDDPESDYRNCKCSRSLCAFFRNPHRSGKQFLTRGNSMRTAR